MCIGASDIFKLEYRIVFAVATLDTVILYDTENSYPIGLVEGIHYAELTDIAWYVVEVNSIRTRNSSFFLSILRVMNSKHLEYE